MLQATRIRAEHPPLFLLFSLSLSLSLSLNFSVLNACSTFEAVVEPGATAMRSERECTVWLGRKEGRKGEESDEVEGCGLSHCTYYILIMCLLCVWHTRPIHTSYIYYILKHLNAPQFFYCFNYTCTHNPKHTHTHTPLHDRRTDLFL